MELGFGLAIIGIIVILLSTIWYFASYLNQLSIMANAGSQPIKNSSGAQVLHSQPGCTPTSVPATGDNISLKEAQTNTVFPTWAAIGWAVGAAMVIGGLIWGAIARSKNKPDSNTARLVNAFLQQQAANPPPATVAATTTTTTAAVPRPVATAPASRALTDAEILAAARRIVAANATA
jgi:hypothetical protein